MVSLSAPPRRVHASVWLGPEWATHPHPSRDLCQTLAEALADSGATIVDDG